MKLFIVRHGQTNYNVQRLSNTKPGEHVYLTDLGKEQAFEIHNKLKNVDFDKVYVSELFRTHQTAQIIAPNKPQNVDKRINDVDTGCEDQHYNAYLNAIAHDRFNAKVGDGESYQDVKKRIQSFLNDLEGNNILIVSHHNPAIVMRALLTNISDEESYKMNFKNCEILEIEK